MKDEKILINTVDKAKKFVEKISTVPCDVDIMVGRYTVDAKSILGVFSIDISRPLKMRIHERNDDEYNMVIDKVGEYITD